MGRKRLRITHYESPVKLARPSLNVTGPARRRMGRPQNPELCLFEPNQRPISNWSPLQIGQVEAAWQPPGPERPLPSQGVNFTTDPLPSTSSRGRVHPRTRTESFNSTSSLGVGNNNLTAAGDTSPPTSPGSSSSTSSSDRSSFSAPAERLLDFWEFNEEDLNFGDDEALMKLFGHHMNHMSAKYPGCTRAQLCEEFAFYARFAEASVRAKRNGNFKMSAQWLMKKAQLAEPKTRTRYVTLRSNGLHQSHPPRLCVSKKILGKTEVRSVTTLTLSNLLKMVYSQHNVPRPIPNVWKVCSFFYVFNMKFDESHDNAHFFPAG